MPPTNPASTTFTPTAVTISGTTYNAANLDEFELKPTSSRAIGGLGGVQYRYLIPDSTTYWALLDRLAVAACDIADVEGDSSHRVLAIYSDMGKI